LRRFYAIPAPNTNALTYLLTNLLVRGDCTMFPQETITHVIRCKA